MDVLILISSISRVTGVCHKPYLFAHTAYIEASKAAWLGRLLSMGAHEALPIEASAHSQYGASIAWLVPIPMNS